MVQKRNKNRKDHDFIVVLFWQQIEPKIDHNTQRNKNKS